MRDDRRRNGPDRVDEEVPGLAVKPFGPDLHPVAGMTHTNRQNVRLNGPSLKRVAMSWNRCHGRAMPSGLTLGLTRGLTRPFASRSKKMEFVVLDGRLGGRP